MKAIAVFKWSRVCCAYKKMDCKRPAFFYFYFLFTALTVFTSFNAIVTFYFSPFSPYFGYLLVFTD